MIDFKPYNSSSLGNLYSISDETTTLMLDCGVPWKKIQRAFNFKTSSIAGCLIGDEHGDHSKAAKDVIKAGIDVYASKGTADALKISGHRVHIIEAHKQFRIGTWEIMPFDRVHDAAEPLAFLMISGNDKALFLIDSNYSKYRFKGLTMVAIAVDFDMDVLKERAMSGKIDISLAKRIVGSHSSLQTALGFFAANDMSQVREVHLLHLSAGNSDAERFRREVQRETGKPVYVAGE